MKYEDVRKEREALVAVLVSNLENTARSGGSPALLWGVAVAYLMVTMLKILIKLIGACLWSWGELIFEFIATPFIALYTWFDLCVIGRWYAARTIERMTRK